MDLKPLIREIPDFPIPGINFKDITTLLQNPQGFRSAIDQLAEQIQAQNINPEYIVGIESRGFIFGAALAYKLGLGFVLVRKPKKLPAPVYAIEYALEYGSDRLEIHQDALPPGSRAIIIDDLLATGGTATATGELIQKTGAVLAGFGFIIELVDLPGRKCLPDVPIISLVQY